MKKTLIYGYGNPGRQDDGLGARFIDLCEEWVQTIGTGQISLDCNYQLNIEDAEIIAGYEQVIFVDASIVDEIDSYKLEKIAADNSSIEFSMHAVSVGFVLDLCQKIYLKFPETYVLHIKAYSFDFIEELTPAAQSNLEVAFEFLKRYLSGYS
ncbi:MAG TPA: hydrogenase maturation protease, partial [Saprospiraceae bacterium]|nr:hydrogenase maturation protease [Saprospiraceae bacterium]